MTSQARLAQYQHDNALDTRDINTLIMYYRIGKSSFNTKCEQWGLIPLSAFIILADCSLI